MSVLQSSMNRPGRERARCPMLSVLLVAVLLAACGGTASPAASLPSSSPAASLPSSSPAASNSGSGACTSVNVRATGGQWGAAAGSRGADVSVENAGSSPCVLPASPAVSLIDPAGSILLASSPGRTGPGPTIGPGETIGLSLVFSNWCDQSVSLPLRFRLALASGEIEIADLSVATSDQLPPCNGPGQASVLSATEWEPR